MADKRYMEQLDEWTEKVILKPLNDAFTDWSNAEDDSDEETQAEKKVVDVGNEIQKAIREKVLQSYRNGQAAGNPAVRQKQTQK